MPLEAGSKLAHYEILEPIGKGGMGEVYRARDTKLHRDVAIKLLPPEFTGEAERNARFEREARAASSLNHPNVVTVYEIGEHEGARYIVMELIEGITLRDALSGGPLSNHDLLHYAAQLAEGLARAHRAGIVHRDIKPENVLVRNDGYVKIVDFGLARPSVRNEADPSAVTADFRTEAGAVLGTLSYMSPEQALGSPLDVGTDVFSLGAVLFEMATGTRAFQGDSAASVFNQILNTTPDRPSSLNPHLVRGLDRIVFKALEKERALRYASAQDLLSDIAAILADVTPQREFKKGIVVLPFRNTSPDPEQEYFCDGITEEIISDLSTIKGLRVISSTSSRRLKGSDKDVSTIGRELDVQFVLEGSVRKAGDSLRITAQLIDSSDDTPLWADKYSGVLEDVFAMQESVSRAIVAGLELTLSPDEARGLAERPITDLGAYETYLMAKRAIWSFQEEPIVEALRQLENAIQLIGENELLYATRGRLHAFTITAGLQPERYDENLEQAERDARSAFALNPNSPQGHSLMGWVLFQKGQLQDAVSALKKAYAQDANSPDTLIILLYGYALSGKLEPARRLAEELLQVDPLNPLNHAMPGFIDIMKGNFLSALPRYEKLSTVDPENPTSQLFYAWALALAGEIEEVAHVSTRCDALGADTVPARTCRFLSHAIRGDETAALRSVNAEVLAAGRSSEMYARFLAEGYALIGRNTDALDWLERDVSLGFINYPFLSEYDPLLANLRGESRFDELMERVDQLWRDFET